MNNPGNPARRYHSTLRSLRELKSEYKVDGYMCRAIFVVCRNESRLMFYYANSESNLDKVLLIADLLDPRSMNLDVKTYVELDDTEVIQRDRGTSVI